MYSHSTSARSVVDITVFLPRPAGAAQPAADAAATADARPRDDRSSSPARQGKRASQRAARLLTSRVKGMVSFVGPEGRRCYYLNAGLPCDRHGRPLAPMHQAICPRCSHGYAELLRDPGRPCCSECQLDASHQASLELLQLTGLFLGWQSQPAVSDLVLRSRRSSPSRLRGLGSYRV